MTKQGQQRGCDIQVLDKALSPLKTAAESHDKVIVSVST